MDELQQLVNKFVNDRDWNQFLTPHFYYRVEIGSRKWMWSISCFLAIKCRKNEEKWIINIENRKICFLYIENERKCWSVYLVENIIILDWF